MILIDKMKNLKIYRQQTFLPTNTKDKKKKAASLLFTPSFESSKKLMMNPLFINKKRYESYYLERDIAFYIGQKKVEDIDDESIEESAYIEETKRSELPDSAFGVPSKRKFPLDTEAHVRSAIKFFNYVDPEDEAELARRIIAAMKKFNITDVKVSEKNRFSKYYHPKKSTNESKELEESYIINEKDILYNKDKFDSGEINLCFITGQSGSGKSTMGRKYSDEGAEHVEMDDLIAIKDHFTMENLKEYGDLIYSFYKGPGKKYYVGMEDLKNVPGSEYEDKLFPEFVKYAMSYSKSHKDKKFVIEGVWIFCDTEKGSPMFSPEQFKDYAFFIKGTSALISNYRASKRDSADQPNKAKAFVDGVRNFTHSLKWYLFNEKQLKKFRDYFSKLEAKSTNEMVEIEDNMDYLMEEAEYSSTNKYPVFIILQHSGTLMANVIQKFTNAEFSHACISFNSNLNPMYTFGNKNSSTIKANPGFVIQNPKDQFFKNYHVYYSVFVMYVDEKAYTAMNNTLQFFIDNKDALKYDFKNLVSILFNKPSENSKKFFCSKFVAEILKAGCELGKVPSLWKPNDFTALNNISLVNHGNNFYEYNSKITEKNLEYIKKHQFNMIKIVEEDADTIDSEEIYKYLSEQDDYLDLGDKLMFFGEATDRSNDQLKKILFRSRIKNRKELLLKLEEVKNQLDFIKYAYPELKRLVGRNVFVDLYYYNAVFFQNNTWVQQRGLNLYLKFMEKLLNHPNLKDAGYEKKTIFIPIFDWIAPKDNGFWNYRIKVTPISCIYQLLFEGRIAALRKVFGDTDVIFVGNNNYFKINFSALNDKDYKKDAITFRTFIRKIIFAENFELDEIDTASENNDSPEVIRNKIIDKIELSKGVDLSAQVQNAAEKLNKQEEINKKLASGKKLTNDEKKEIESNKATSVVKITQSLSTNQNVSITKQDTKTKEEINKKKEEKISNIKNSTKISTAKAKEEEDIDMDVDVDTQEETIDKIADYIAKASENNNTEDDAMDSLENDEEFKLALLSLQSDDSKVDISPTRAARMNKMNEDLLAKEVNGKTIADILNDDSNKKEEVTNIDVASPNQEEWKDMTYINFDKNYNIDKDIINIFRHFSTCTRPISIRNIKVTDSSTAYDRTSLYDVDMEDYRGKRFNIKLDIPIMEDNRFLLRGNSKSIQTQFFNAPIIKTEVDTCQLISNYNKVFLYRFGAVGKSSPIIGRILKAANKYKGNKLKFVSGYNLKVCNKYQLPIDYIDMATYYSYIETPDMIIYFNQDEIRKNYTIEAGKGVPFAYHKKENCVIYFTTNNDPTFSFDKLLIDILKNADNNFFELFEATSAPKSGMFARASILNSKIPVVIVCSYLIGLRQVMDRAGIKYTLEPKLTKEIRSNYNLDWVRFEDGYIVYEQSYSSNIIMNGLKVCSTDLFKLEDIDNKNMYFEFLDNFGGRIKADGLDNFNDLFVDPMVKESLEFYKLPTNFIDIMLYGSTLLADNKFIRHTDTSSRKLRRYQIIAVYTYNALSTAYAMYANKLKHNSNNAEFSVKRSAVIDMFLSDTITSDDSCINALRDVETTNAITTKGPSGLNTEQGYTLDKRAYDESMINVLGMSTGFAGNVGITRQTTMQPNITPDGYIKKSDVDTDNMNDVNTLTATEALIPMSSTHDDPMRVAMSFVQTAKHEVRTEESDPLLVTNGSDEAMAYITTNRFAHKAKGDGKIIELTDDYMIIQYADGTNDFINLKETIEHNSDGGYYVPLKLDADPKLKVGMKVNKDQIVAYDKYSFSNSLGESDNIAYNVGKLAKVAVVNSDEGFEDSGVISESMSKKLATRINIGYSAIINMDSRVYKIAKIGDHIEASDDLIIWEDAFDDEDANDILNSLMSNNGDFSDLGKRRVKSEVTGVLRDMKIYRTCELENMSDSVRKIVTEYEKPIKEMLKVAEKYEISKDKIPAAYSLAPNGKLKKAQNAIYIEFYVEYLDTVGVGDKVVYNAANKAVEKSIFPKGLEPYTAFRPNEIVDAFVSEVSIDKRLVTSSIISGALNKLMVELDRSVKNIMGIPFDDTTV